MNNLNPLSFAQMAHILGGTGGNQSKSDGANEEGNDPDGWRVSDCIPFPYCLERTVKPNHKTMHNFQQLSFAHMSRLRGGIGKKKSDKNDSDETNDPDGWGTLLS